MVSEKESSSVVNWAHLTIVDPSGTVIASSNEESGIVYTDIDKDILFGGEIGELLRNGLLTEKELKEAKATLKEDERNDPLKILKAASDLQREALQKIINGNSYW